MRSHTTRSLGLALILLCLSSMLFAQDLQNEVYVDIGSFLTDDFTLGYQKNSENRYYGADISVISETLKLIEEHKPTGFFLTIFYGTRSILRDRSTSLYLKYTRSNFSITNVDDFTTTKYRSDALMIMISEELWSTDRLFFKADTGIGVMPTRFFSNDGSNLKRRGYHFDFWQMGGIAVSAKFKFGVRF